MVDHDIAKAIERIDKKIKSLNQAKRILLEEFGGEEIAMSKRTKCSTPSLNFNKPGGKTRKEVLKELIVVNGPLTRREIIEKTGFPKGTLAYVLNDKNLFCNIDGKWHLTKDLEILEVKDII